MSTFSVRRLGTALTLIATATNASIKWNMNGNEVSRETNRGDEGDKERGYMNHIGKFIQELLSTHWKNKKDRLQMVADLLNGHKDITTFRTLSNVIRRDAWVSGSVPAIYFFEGAPAAWYDANKALTTSTTKVATAKAPKAKSTVRKSAPVVKAKATKPAKKVATKKTKSTQEPVATVTPQVEPTTAETTATAE